MGRSHLVVILMATLGLWVLQPAAAAQEKDLPEHRLKAAFIYNFVKFTTWPPQCFPDEQSPVVIGVYGSTPVRKHLEEGTQGKTVGKRPVRVVGFADTGSIGDCHVLYVPEMDAAALKGLLGKVAGKPVLTVGDNVQFLPTGGIIRLFMEDNKIRFEVNVKRAERAGIKLSAQLLQLARIYEE